MTTSIKTLDKLVSDARSRYPYKNHKGDWTTTTKDNGTVLVYFRGELKERYSLK